MTSVDLDLLAANLRAGASDVHAFVETLGTKLEDVLPGKVAVKRGRGGIFGAKSVRRISVDAGDQRLELVYGSHGEVATTCARLSGGIVLKREAVDMETWLGALGEAVAAEAGRNDQTRQALERLLTR